MTKRSECCTLRVRRRTPSLLTSDSVCSANYIWCSMADFSLLRLFKLVVLAAYDLPQLSFLNLLIPIVLVNQFDFIKMILRLT